MLSVKDRQTYLKNHGFYTGAIDGIEGSGTKAAYKAFQKKYMRPQDVDGIYGANTDIALLNLARVTKRCPNFELTEFKCECGGKYCTGYPAYLNTNLLDNIQKVRNKYKQPITITSGLRCKGYNAVLNGSISNSRHMQGKALDFYVPGKTTTEAGRITVMNYWKKLSGANFEYCYLPTKYRTTQEKTATYMGNAVHCDVK